MIWLPLMVIEFVIALAIIDGAGSDDTDQRQGDTAKKGGELIEREYRKRYGSI